MLYLHHQQIHTKLTRVDSLSGFPLVQSISLQSYWNAPVRPRNFAIPFFDTPQVVAIFVTFGIWLNRYALSRENHGDIDKRQTTRFLESRGRARGTPAIRHGRPRGVDIPLRR